MTGRRVERLRRRAKYLLADLDGGETWIAHLGMSGRFTVYPPGSNAGAMLGEFVHDAGLDPAAAPGLDRHDHVLIEADDGGRVVFNDHRRFGYMDLVATDALDASRFFRDLGPEPLAPPLSADALIDALAGKAAPVKAALLDQRVVAGLGNIYVCEALHRAGIHPRRAAGSLSKDRVARLAAEIVATLQEAVEAGGSTLRDFAGASGEFGYFQHRFKAYGREGEACARPGCRGRVARIVQSGRSTFYCVRCQR